MAEAMIRGLIKGGHVGADRIHASAPRTERLDELKKAYAINVTRDNRDVASAAGLVVLSVKPQILDKVLIEIKDKLRSPMLLISIAAGVDTETIEAVVPDGVRVVRA